MTASSVAKIGWNTLIKPLLGVLLTASLIALVYMRGRMDEAARIYESAVMEALEIAKEAQKNAEAAAQDAVAEVESKKAREEFFDAAESQVIDFYAERAKRTPQERPDATPDHPACPDADFFDADELRLFNQGNRASDFGIRAE